MMQAEVALRMILFSKRRLLGPFLKCGLLFGAAFLMQACARTQPNSFANAPALQPECRIDTEHGGSRSRTFEAAVGRFKKGTRLTYTWSSSDDPGKKVSGREFTIAFESTVPRRAVTIHLMVNASDGSQAACGTVIW